MEVVEFILGGVAALIIIQWIVGTRHTLLVYGCTAEDDHGMIVLRITTTHGKTWKFAFRHVDARHTAQEIEGLTRAMDWKDQPKPGLHLVREDSNVRNGR